MSIQNRMTALGLSLVVVACSNEAARHRPDMSDPFAAAERMLNKDGGTVNNLMARQFTPGESKYSDDTGLLLPENYTPPDFERIDLGGMGIQEAPSFGIAPDGMLIRRPNRLRRVILPPGFGPQVVIDSESGIGIAVPAETIRGDETDEAKEDAQAEGEESAKK